MKFLHSCGLTCEREESTKLSVDIFSRVTCYWLTLLFFTSPHRTRSSSSASSSSSSSSPDIFGNGPAPCQGASLHPAVWLASCKSEEGSGQVIEPAHLSLSLLAHKWLLTFDSAVTQPWPLASHALPAEAAAHAALQRPEQELLCDTDSPAGQQCYWMHSVSGEYGTGMSGGGGPKAGATGGQSFMQYWYMLVLDNISTDILLFRNMSQQLSSWPNESFYTTCCEFSCVLMFFLVGYFIVSHDQVTERCDG